MTDGDEIRMADYRRKQVFRLSIVRFLMLLCLLLAVTSVSAQTLEISLLDGRNGRPMVGASSYVNVWVGTERKEAIAIPADEKGIVRLKLTLDISEVNIPNAQKSGLIVVAHPVLKYNEFFRINAPYVRCELYGSNHSWLRSDSFSMTEILQRGYVSPNICGDVTVLRQPGRMVLFVRPLSWWERLKQ